MVKKTKTMVTEEFLKKTCNILRDMSRSKENYEMLLRPHMQDPIKFDRVVETLQKMILDNYNSNAPRPVVRSTKAQVAEAKAKKAAPKKAKLSIQETKDIIASMRKELGQLEEQITRYQNAIITLVDSLEEV